MNALIDAQRLLQTQLARFPRAALAQAMATLDPLWLQIKQNGELNGDDDPVVVAMQISRTLFPDIYVRILNALRSRMDDNDLDALIIAEFAEKGFVIGTLDQLAWGIPMDVIGVDITDGNFDHDHPELMQAFSPFRYLLPPSEETADDDDDTDDYEDDEYYRLNQSDEITELYRLGNVISDSLLTEYDINLRHVGRLYSWIFSCSDNSIIDLTDDNLDALEPLVWEAEDVEFARTLIQQANEIMTDAKAGIVYLRENPDLLNQVTRNLKKVIKERNPSGNHNLRWERTSSSPV